jgi:hypothetical protein
MIRNYFNIFLSKKHLKKYILHGIEFFFNFLYFYFCFFIFMRLNLRALQWGKSSKLKHINRVQKQNVLIIMLQSGPSIQ